MSAGNGIAPKQEFIVGPPNMRDKNLVEFRRRGHVLHSARFDPFDQFTADKSIQTYLQIAGTEAAEIEKETRLIRSEIQNAAKGIETGVEQLEYTGYSLAELADMDLRIDYIVDGFMVKGQPMIVGGPSKTLKSTITLELAICIATDRPFLGVYEIKQPQPVVIMSGESGLPTLKEKAFASLKAKGLTLYDVPNLFLSADVPQITSQRHIDATGRFLSERDAKVLFIDPTYLAMPGDQMSNVFGQGEYLKDFSRFATDADVTWGTVHHAKKTITHYDQLDRGDLAGAGFGEFMRQWMLINNRVRPDMDRGNFKLWMNFGGSAGHNGAWGIDIHEGIFSPSFFWREWNCELIPPSECRQEAANQQEEQRAAKVEQKTARETETMMKRVLKKLTKPKTKRQLRDELGKGKAVALAIEQLQDENRIEATMVMAENNQKYDGYKLAE